MSLPATPCVLVAEDLAPADTAGLDPEVVHALVTEKGGPTSHTAIIARQLGIPCVVGTAGALGDRQRHAAARRRHRRHHRDRARRRRGRPPRRGRPRATRGAGLLGRAGPHQGRRPGQAARQRRRRRVGPQGRRPAGRGRRPVPHRAVLPRPAGGAERRGAGRHLRGGARALRGGPVRRRPHPRRRLRQARRLRHPGGRGEPRAGRARAAPVVGQPGPAGPPARRHRRGRQAHRHRDLGDGTDGGHRRRGRATSPTRCGPAGSRPA